MRVSLIIAAAALLAVPALSQDTVWTRIYTPAADNYSDQQLGGCATSDGNFVCVGYTTSFQIWLGDCYLMKIKTDGDTSFGCRLR